MKHINSVINVVLAVAVIVLFYLHFSSGKKSSTVVAAPKTGNHAAAIAYFEMDSVQNNFEYYKEIIKDLTKKDQQVRAGLDAKKNAYLSKLKEYQGKSNTMTQEQLAQASQEMQAKEREYNLEEQMQASQLNNETREKLLDVKKKIEEFLKEYNKNRTYAYIISNSADLIYYKDSANNITEDIVKGLNEKFKPKKSK